MITQMLDPADPVLAFTLKWVQALAARVDHLYVICLEQRTTTLPANVTAFSMGKEHGKGRGGELRAFYRALSRVIRKVDVIFCHMIPRFVWLAAPYAKLLHKPLILWYTHRQITTELRLATALCRHVVSAVPDSFPLSTPKLRAVGHGIDTDFYTPDPQIIPDAPPLIVHVARLMPIKHQATLLQAVAAGIDAQVMLIGAVPQGQDRTYLTQLQTLAHELGIADRVNFAGGLSPDQVRDLYRRASIAVNLSPPGLFDKAALESMLVGTLTVVSNPAFDAVLRDHAERLRIAAPDDVQGLTVCLRTLLTLPDAQRSAIALDIRGRAKTAHSLDGLMDRLIGIMAGSRG